jgi:ribosomal protein S18 acetylase RimI-like enzyme
MKSLLKTSLNTIKNFYPAFSAQAESKFNIRTLQLPEFEKVIKVWARKEGWNPGKYEYLPFYIACQGGHKGLFSSSNQLIASLSAVHYSKDYTFLGIYIVDPNFREQGVGEKLAKTVLSELDSCSLMGLNGVKKQVGNYQKKYGFRPFYNNFRFSGTFKSTMYTILEPEKKIKIIGRETINVNQLIDFDANVFSFVRESFLRKWIEMPESYLLAAIEDEKICGYGVVSKCVSGYKIAPFFAKNEKVAKALYDGFYSRFKDKLMQLDIPEPNESAIKLATQFGLYKTLETKRMYKGESKLIQEQNLKNDQIYSLTSLEIG